MERPRGGPPPAGEPSPGPPGASAAAPSPLRPFLLERFFARWEFVAPHLLCCSDAEPLRLADLLALNAEREAHADSFEGRGQSADGATGSTAADAAAGGPSASASLSSRWQELALGYTTTEGDPALRAAVARRYATLAPQHVLISAPQEGVYLAVTALVRPGDHVVVTWPGYASLLEIARAAGATVSCWEPAAAGAAPGAGAGAGAPPAGPPRFDPAHLAALLRPQTALVLINFPHNPTGALPTQDEFREIVRLVEANGSVLFSDEMYRGLERDPAARLPAAADLSARAVSLCGLSKAVGAPGLRIGWLATRHVDLLKRAAELKDFTTICPAAPSEILGLMVVRAWDALAARATAVIDANLLLLQAFARRWPHVIDFAAPAAGTVAFPRLNFRALGAADVASCCEDLAARDGVLLLPADVYEHGPSVAAGRVRLGFGRASLPAALAALEAALARRGLAPREVGAPAQEAW